jgi:hypothetical protein
MQCCYAHVLLIVTQTAIPSALADFTERSHLAVLRCSDLLRITSSLVCLLCLLKEIREIFGLELSEVLFEVEPYLFDVDVDPDVLKVHLA